MLEHWPFFFHMATTPSSYDVAITCAPDALASSRLDQPNTWQKKKRQELRQALRQALHLLRGVIAKK